MSELIPLCAQMWYTSLNAIDRRAWNAPANLTQSREGSTARAEPYFSRRRLAAQRETRSAGRF